MKKDYHIHAMILHAATVKVMRFVYGSDAHRAEDVGIMLPTLEVHPLYADVIRRFDEE